ncbi:MAG: hypothetical protein LUH03_09995 [Oscillospiraceae bacterium]|nr:hypothetical protein [Oscillospiraceae bacterium]
MAYVSGLNYSSDEIQAIYTGESSEPIILIDAVNRTMEVAADHKILGVVGDHNSNPVRFRCPRYIDGGDLATCTNLSITWQNEDAGTKGTADIGDFSTDPDDPDNYIVGTWLVDYATCANAGQVGIFFTAIQLDADGETVYEWQTVENAYMEVKPGPNGMYSDVYDTSGSGSFYIDEDELVAMLEEVLA